MAGRAAGSRSRHSGLPHQRRVAAAPEGQAEVRPHPRSPHAATTTCWVGTSSSSLSWYMPFARCCCCARRQKLAAAHPPQGARPFPGEGLVCGGARGERLPGGAASSHGLPASRPWVVEQPCVYCNARSAPLHPCAECARRRPERHAAPCKDVLLWPGLPAERQHCTRVAPASQVGHRMGVNACMAWMHAWHCGIVALVPLVYCMPCMQRC